MWNPVVFPRILSLRLRWSEWRTPVWGRRSAPASKWWTARNARPRRSKLSVKDRWGGLWWSSVDPLSPTEPLSSTFVLFFSDRSLQDSSLRPLRDQVPADRNRKGDCIFTLQLWLLLQPVTDTEGEQIQNEQLERLPSDWLFELTSAWTGGDKKIKNSWNLNQIWWPIKPKCDKSRSK